MGLEYGVIGNCRTAALVSGDASIDWLCLPKFDSPSVFSRILDTKKGGEFAIRPVGRYATKQEYVKDTNVLKTTFSNRHSSFEVIDFFPHYRTGRSLLKEAELYRVIRVLSGAPSVRFMLRPKFNYASLAAKPQVLKDYVAYSGETENMYVYSNANLRRIVDGRPTQIRKDTYVVLSYNRLKEDTGIGMIMKQLEKTVSYWKRWVEEAKLPKEHRDLVARSALVLRLLTYDNSGAIVAAATTSLPEIVGDVRNWDYRYCWIRDASFTVLALIKITRFDVVYEFLGWLRNIYTSYGVNFQGFFGVDGNRNLEEKTLDYLSGYEDSKPVRVGNAAYTQKQPDIFGEALDALHIFYLEYKTAQIKDEIHWDLIYSMVEAIIKEWRNPDHSVWEFRTKIRHYTLSKVLYWTAIDRGIRLADHYGRKDVIAKWQAEADTIRKDVMDNGWNQEMGAFTQSYGSKDLDADVLLMPYFGFITYEDPKMKSTIEAIEKELFRDGFVARYNGKDDYDDPKTALIACTFWFIDALSGIGRKEEAKVIFNNVISHANHLGLLSEDINAKTGELLGNFPQAYSHIALINTAMDLFG